MRGGLPGARYTVYISSKKIRHIKTGALCRPHLLAFYRRIGHRQIKRALADPHLKCRVFFSCGPAGYPLLPAQPRSGAGLQQTGLDDDDGKNQKEPETLAQGAALKELVRMLEIV